MAIHTYSNRGCSQFYQPFFTCKVCEVSRFSVPPTSITNSSNPRRERSAHVNKPFSAGQAVRTWQQLELLLTYFMVKRWIHGCFGSRRCSNLRELDAANRLMSAALNFQIQTVRQCRKSRKIEATQSRTKNWAFRSFFSFLSFFSLHARFPSSSIDLCRECF